MKLLIALSGLLAATRLVHSAGVFDVTKYGAQADGTHLNTDAFQKAIAAAEKAGGGTVLFPKGSAAYLTGPIELRSKVDLELADGAVIKFSDSFDLYKDKPLIHGSKVSQVTIKGKGTFDGSGKKWWDEFEKNKNFHRPALFSPSDCDHLTLLDVTFKDSPMFVVNPHSCQNLLLDSVKVNCPATAHNTDGIHISSGRNVVVRNCEVSTGDDGIVFTSSGTAVEGKYPFATENITVHDCVVHEAHGGIVIGSVIAGGVRNFHAKNLRFMGTQRGIRIKSYRDKGGVLEDLHYESITMHGILHEAITIDALYAGNPGDTTPGERAFDSKTPIYKNIHIKNVTGDSVDGIQLIGLPEKHFDAIELVDVTITAKHAMVEKNVDHLVKTNLTYHVN